MIASIIAYCARNFRITIALALVLAIWGGYCLNRMRIDAIPDLSETQVIIFTEWMGRSPELVEEQVTYPLVTSMLASPHVSLVRGQSMFGMSFVYVIFEDGTDLYWARSRVLESLSKLSGRLPDGVNPAIGPDASGVGWVYQYVLVDPSGKNNLQEIRTFQDWYLKYWLSSVAGVAEVASIGGFEKQYQVEIDPNRLSALKIPIERVINAIRESNRDVGGRTLEISEREFYVRGRGYVKSAEDLENVTISTAEGGVPVRLTDVGRVSIGPQIRRGVSDFNGEGDTVGGVVVMRQGADVSATIEAVKMKLADVKAAFPPGVEIRPVYDRSGLIQEAVSTLRNNIIEEMVLVGLVILVFLFHARSALVVVITMPLAVLISLIPMYYLDISLNIMSMGGIILAIGDIVDGIVVFIENSHKKLAENSSRPRTDLIIEACQEMGPSIFSALLIIAISFLPIFALQAQEGKLFHPLAYTKTFAMIAAAIVTVTVTAPLIMVFVRGKIRSEAENPVNRAISKAYSPILAWSLRKRKLVLTLLALAVVGTGVAFSRLGSEFMPPLWEGDLLYMPITVPGMSITAASDLVQRQGKAIRSIPEVESVFGKAGRYETPTDPAPLSMFEYTIRLKPRDQWRSGLNEEKLLQLLDDAVAVPGLNRAWTKPIRGRIDMLSTGIRTPVGIKVFAKDLPTIESIGRELEAALVNVRGTRSVYAERLGGGSYLDFDPDRRALQRYGLNVGDALNVIETAVGGMEISQTVEGRERYTINVRYPRELRDTVEKVGRILVATPSGAQIPIGQLGKLTSQSGAPMIFNENGSLVGYVYIDLEGRDPGGYVNDAKEAVARSVQLPQGAYLKWTGQYENLARMQERMKIILPLTLFLIFGVLYFGVRSLGKTVMIMVSVPLSLIGGILLMWALGYNTSVAVWAGAIALVGVAVETAAIMVVFLDRSWSESAAKGRLSSPVDCLDATVAGAGASLRAVLMAVLMNIFGLMPVMMATGLGADVMKRISSPMFGGLITLAILTLIILPIVYMMSETRRRGVGATSVR
ncbi:MAG: CusA/CzcA family heavy metal efflux RND transporter [Bdellovibrionaceae bacterium]|nr:CusA/CzcA family heavy metal efflux RND transporter [Pseudobdellovibrionaceae bacterium]